MKIAMLHLSDFHVKDGDYFLPKKTEGIFSALNVLGVVDEYMVVFTGDLANSGQINEYKRSRYIFNLLINELKKRNNNKFVNLLMVPGNHDLCLPKKARTGEDISDSYENGKINELLELEVEYLNNYYEYSYANEKKPYDIFLSKKYLSFDGYKIQFNLINTAPLSTLKPDDKELHYFPEERIHALDRGKDANLCITIMHHNYEWFNWRYKGNLEKAIVDNSEILFHGHDHTEKTSTLSINESIDTWISSAGQMKLTSLDTVDSFNVLVIDTENNTFDGYIYTWDNNEKIYTHKLHANNHSLQSHSRKLSPLPSFIKSMKEDSYNLSPDFTQYFVFPKLVSNIKNNLGNNETITNICELKDFISKERRIVVTGAANSGKTTLLKYLYCTFVGENIPLYLSVDNKQRIKANNFIKHLFEEQYGEDNTLYERFQQSDLNKKILIIDGWDLLNVSGNKKKVLSEISESFGMVIISVSDNHGDLFERVKEELEEEISFNELRIKPFFSDKRNELVKNICMQQNRYSNDDINNVNKLIDSLVQNNSGLFSLNPAFIVRYTNFFIQDPYHDYANGEAVFSKIFEHELTHSIMKHVKKVDADEVFTTFEQIAGYMYSSKKDIISIEELKNIVDNYNESYGLKVNTKDIIDVGVNSKILKQLGDLSIYFNNKNHLSYFIAKHLIRLAQEEPSDNSGIEYALKNICFGINSDIVLFISYLMNNTKMIMAIANYAGELLQPWNALSFNDENISLLHNTPIKKISPPSEEEMKQYEGVKEKIEEKNYSEGVVEPKGVFEYDDNDIDKYPNRLIRAIKYTEMLCKSLTAFYSSLKIKQKNELIDAIYLYPRKIVYAMLRPWDMKIKDICKEMVEYTIKRGLINKDGNLYTEDDIKTMFMDTSRAIMLSMFDHFAELSISPKTNELLENKTTDEISEQIERLLIIENSGNSDLFLKEAEILLDKHGGTEYEMMIKLIARKHLFTNKHLNFNKKQKIIDKIFGKGARKYFLAHRN